MKKRIILLLAAWLLLSVANTLAQSGTTGPLTWDLENNTLTISGEGEMPDYDYSDNIPWFEYRASIYTVVIETGVTTIGSRAFSFCENLTSITIPNSVITIGMIAFVRALSLISIIIPNSVTTIGEFAFEACNLNSIIIPNSVTTIGAWAFSTCQSLSSVTLSNNIKKIEVGTFHYCPSLTSITIPDGVTTIGEQAFSWCMSLTSVTIPNSVTTIGKWAFSECVILPSIVIPNSVTALGGGAFTNCFNLASITLSDNITAIEAGTFWYCQSLTSIIIPNGVTKIGRTAFICCISLTSVNIPESVTTIEEWAFVNCNSLTSITIPCGVMNIGNNAFIHCSSLTSIAIPSSVTAIGEYAFSNCTSLPSIEVESTNNSFISENGVLLDKNRTTLICHPAGKIEPSYIMPASVTKIVNGAFFGCANLTSIEVENGNNSFVSENGVLFNKDKTTLICYPIGQTATSYIIPNSVTTVGRDAFYGCANLTSVTIPNSVTKIGRCAFCYCPALTSITLPKSVNYIEDNAFGGSENLTLITCLSLIPPATSADAFDAFNQNACTLKVPTSAVSVYKNAARWKEFGNIIGGGILVNPISNNIKYGYATGDGLYEAGETATITATARDGYKFLRWTKGGTEVSTNNPYSFTVTEDVELVAHFEYVVGIEETDNYPSVRVYPNPATGELQVTSYELQVTGVEVFDVFGRNVGVKLPSFGGVGGGDISHLPAGIYFLRIQTENGVVVRKVVKQ